MAAPPEARQVSVTNLRRDVEVVRRHPCVPTELAGVRESPDHVKKRESSSEASPESCGRRDGVWTN
jgi:hypothetical protein